MPFRPLQLCVVTGCPNRVPYGRCAEHAAEADRERGRRSDAKRPSAWQRGYDGRWQAKSRRYLDEHPMCEDVSHFDQPEFLRPAATDVDHRDGGGPLGPRGYDDDNLQALCHPCHSRKTIEFDGGFGRARRRDFGAG